MLREAEFCRCGLSSDQPKLAELLTQRIGAAQGNGTTLAIAAPHASPDGGWATYRAAYRCLPSAAEAAGKTFVILGTSHYGAPERFGLTRKNFLTPFGEAQTNSAWWMSWKGPRQMQS